MLFDQSIRFCFNATKAAQAAGIILNLSQGKRNYMELVKLLYLADRKALIELENPITGDKFVSLPYGPVLSRILNLIREGPVTENDAPWFDVVSPREGYDVRILKSIGDDELSNAEIRILKEVFSEYGNLNWKELSRVTHALPEWSDPDGGPIPITPETILALGGKTPEDIQNIKQEAQLFRKLDVALPSAL